MNTINVDRYPIEIDMIIDKNKKLIHSLLSSMVKSVVFDNKLAGIGYDVTTAEGDLGIRVGYTTGIEEEETLAHVNTHIPVKLLESIGFDIVDLIDSVEKELMPSKNIEDDRIEGDVKLKVFNEINHTLKKILELITKEKVVKIPLVGKTILEKSIVEPTSLEDVKRILIRENPLKTVEEIENMMVNAVIATFNK